LNETAREGVSHGGVLELPRRERDTRHAPLELHLHGALGDLGERHRGEGERGEEEPREAFLHRPPRRSMNPSRFEKPNWKTPTVVSIMKPRSKVRSMGSAAAPEYPGTAIRRSRGSASMRTPRLA